MANLRNRVQLVGNLGMDPEVKAFDNGRKLAKFTLATNESFIGANGQERTETQWHNIIAWGKQAEIAQKYLQKGNEVAIEGRLTHRQYEDKDKQTRYVTEVVLSSYVIFPDFKK
ncbi:single-stranded DNA-binding protein [Carboxylicivirga marina]|uniref:Single-stranded DNA-binding protein n=1 Tax=Carboxylicivirga marina TaxID=2800988 RepID=A0ABS1HIV3_9BACT|nr:single-stranded DNA-binding protein [Carboxylicivirga marina]MBK3517596.1 single-stranded DNA-binding protein [Carboxylicivirga marina]